MHPSTAQQQRTWKTYLFFLSFDTIKTNKNHGWVINKNIIIRVVVYLSSPWHIIYTRGIYKYNYKWQAGGFNWWSNSWFILAMRTRASNFTSCCCIEAAATIKSEINNAIPTCSVTHFFSPLLVFHFIGNMNSSQKTTGRQQNSRLLLLYSILPLADFNHVWFGEVWSQSTIYSFRA